MKTVLVKIVSSVRGQKAHPNIWYKNDVGKVFTVKPECNFDGNVILGVVGTKSEHDPQQTIKIFPLDADVLIFNERTKDYTAIPYEHYHLAVKYNREQS
jgi:hypothetical protein